MASNAIFAIFAAEVKELFAHDIEVIEEIRIAEALHGISLDELLKRNPELALRFVSAIRAAAESIIAGIPPQISQIAGRDVELAKPHFQELLLLTERFKLRVENPGE